MATCNPRDICFVVDLSGSMNNDTDPYNTGGIDSSYPGVGTQMMQDIYSDFGYGTYPGSSQYIGQPLGLSSSSGINGLTSTTSSPLLYSKKSSTKTKYNYTVPSQYLIYVSGDGSGKTADSSTNRTTKAYSWVIDEQIHGMSGSSAMPGIMPAAKPTTYALPSTGTLNTNYYNYWQYYLSSYSTSIGYSSYTHMMMYYGWALKPASNSTLYTPLSIKSPDCPYHADTTQKGDTFNFPPREMPTHASRLAIIDALRVINDRNLNISDPSQCDWVSIVTFDLTSDVVVLHDLDTNYQAAMQACTTMQASGDDVSCTATETGFITAINLLNTKGRQGANKVVVLMTDGIPNLYSSSGNTISNYINAHANTNYYNSSSNYSEDAAMMQAATMQGNNWSVFPVELGLQGHADFMNRIYSVSQGKTTTTLTNPYNATGDPSNYETLLINIFNKIISNPKLRLVNYSK